MTPKPGAKAAQDVTIRAIEPGQGAPRRSLPQLTFMLSDAAGTWEGDRFLEAIWPTAQRSLKGQGSVRVPRRDPSLLAVVPPPAPWDQETPPDTRAKHCLPPDAADMRLRPQ